MTPYPIQLRRRKGLTLIEILVVMAIILILMGLFIAGLKQWGDSAKRNVTLTRMELLNGMLSELDAEGHNQFLSQWFFTQTGGAQVGLYANAFGNVTPEAQGSMYTNATLVANGTPVVANNNRYLALAYLTYPATNTFPLPSPFMTPAVLGSSPAAYMPATYGIENKLLSLPNNQKAIAGLPSNAVATLPPNTIPGYTPVPAPQPVVLDGWGNPILFCPSGGLADVYVNVKNNATPQALPLTITSPDGRPFWASAGPDGDFVKGDDNIYSFQQQ